MTDHTQYEKLVMTNPRFFYIYNQDKQGFPLQRASIVPRTSFSGILDFSYSNNDNISFNGIDLSYKSFLRASLMSCQFHGADLTYSRFVESILIGSSFSKETRFKDSDIIISRADFKYCLLLLAKDEYGNRITRTWLKEKGVINADLAITNIEELNELLISGKIALEVIFEFIKYIKLFSVLHDIDVNKRIQSRLENVIHDESELLSRAFLLLKQHTDFIPGDLAIGNKFAEGGYSDVHSGTYQLKQVAIKYVHKKCFYDNELTILNVLKIPDENLAKNNIIQFYGSYETAGKMGLVFSLAEYTLQKWISSAEFNLTIAYRFLRELTQAVIYLHRCNIIHNDIKVTNALLVVENNIWHAKLSDFGGSVLINAMQESPSVVVGTRYYLPPERLYDRKNASQPGDIYSLGLLSWETICRQSSYRNIFPFQNKPNHDEFSEKILLGVRPRLNYVCPPTTASLINTMWHPLTNCRPSAEMCLKELELSDQYITACRRIEKSRFFRASSPKNEKNNVKDFLKNYTNYNLCLIKRAYFNMPFYDHDSIGAFYEVRQSTKEKDEYFLLLVDKNGRYSFHTLENAKKGNLNEPLTHIKIADILKYKSTPGIEKFISICQKIESDPNYQPSITTKELFNLVVDENGNARHSPRRSALAIKRFHIKTSTTTDDSVEKAYQIKIVDKSYIDNDNDEYPIWNMESVVVLVNKKGECSFYRKENAKQGNFNSPLTNLSIDLFLNQPCLHYPVDQQKTKISNSM